MSLPNDLAGQITYLFGELEEIKRRNRNRKRTGTISKLDLGKGLARVEFQSPDGKPYLGPWMPWKEVASGGIKTHIPPTLGEQVDVLSESGDMGDGVIDMSIPSTDNPRPHDGAEAVLTKGDTRISIGDGEVSLKSPIVNIIADEINLGGSGGKKVARIGDMVRISSGSSAGLHPIVQGSSVVKAT